MKKNRKEIQSLAFRESFKNFFSSVKNNIGMILISMLCGLFMYIILSL